jgi:hypothetical protein
MGKEFKEEEEEGAGDWPRLEDIPRYHQDD